MIKNQYIFTPFTRESIYINGIASLLTASCPKKTPNNKKTAAGCLI